MKIIAFSPEAVEKLKEYILNVPAPRTFTDPLVHFVNAGQEVEVPEEKSDEAATA